MNLPLDSIRRSLEGVIPGVVATCDKDGMPNVTYVSQIHYIDRNHVALSFQFFNKTRDNMLQNPQLTAYLIDPVTTARYRLALLYLRTETAGPLFQIMKAKLAGIASHTGMSGIFALRGADICRVLEVEAVPGEVGEPPRQEFNWLSALRSMNERLQRQWEMAAVFEELMAGMKDTLGIPYTLLLMADNAESKLYTVASSGYPNSGVGSEIPYGCGVIGVAAQFKTPIRITHMAAEYGYGRAVRDTIASSELLETEIPFPGLEAPSSQVAVPLCNGDRLLAVLYVESEQDLYFDYDDEDGLLLLAQQAAHALIRVQQNSDVEPDQHAVTELPSSNDKADLVVRYYPANHSIFLAEEYLIKGVAGAILWRLLNCYQQDQRTEFSNRELRLDKQLNLPEIDDNLEARLILLQRRLAEKSQTLALVKTGRGRFTLVVQQPIRLLMQESA